MFEMIFIYTDTTPFVLEHWMKGLPLTYSKLTFITKEDLHKHIEQDKSYLDGINKWHELHP